MRSGGGTDAARTQTYTRSMLCPSMFACAWRQCATALHGAADCARIQTKIRVRRPATRRARACREKFSLYPACTRVPREVQALPGARAHVVRNSGFTQCARARAVRSSGFTRRARACREKVRLYPACARMPREVQALPSVRVRMRREVRFLRDIQIKCGCCHRT